MGRFVFIYLLTFIVVMCGCNRDDEIIISSMIIEDIQIHTSKIDQEFKERAGPFNGNPENYAVTIFIQSSLGGCRSYHKTRLFPNFDSDEIPLGLVTTTGVSGSTYWAPGETIRLEITESEPKSDGSFSCSDDFYYWYQAISIGFCIPGQYTLDVNKNIYTFTIDGSDGTVRIHETS